MVLIEKLIAFFLLGVALNIPFGSYRLMTLKFSLAWWLSIHLPIPALIILRSFAFGLPLWALLVSLAAAVTGQVLGSRLPRCGQGVNAYLNRLNWSSSK